MATPKKKPEDKLKAGRPTLYSEELAALICERVATCTYGLARMCDLYDDLPVKSTINLWRYKYPEFSTQYALAKLKQIDLMAEEIIEIADDGSNDWMESFGEEGEIGYRLNGEHVQRSRLRIDTRKWLASKLLPKQYGQKVDEDDEANKKSLIEALIDKLTD
jgi:hypothetical protein